MATAHFGIAIPQINRGWEESLRAAREFEAMGYDSFWVYDHLYVTNTQPMVPFMEAWSMLAALAAVTERVELGTLVTPVGMRHPAYLANVIATVDNIAGGRCIAGLGAGWMEKEFRDVGRPFHSTGARLRQLRETIVLLRRLWTEQTVDFDGEFVGGRNLACEPKPARMPPIMVGGAGEKVTMRIAAEQADIWNNSTGHQKNLAHKVQVLRKHCEDVGRDPAEVTVSQQCTVIIGVDDAAVARMVDRARTMWGFGNLSDPEDPMAITGTPDRVRERIQAHLDLGCTMFQFEFFGRDTVPAASLFAEKVLPHFK